jgi:N-acetylmuramoyl-L-alanine amidase
MSGPDVIVLQAILAARGYSVNAINGVFDDSTDKAVREFQRDNGLAVDGIAGPMTWGKILEV